MTTDTSNYLHRAPCPDLPMHAMIAAQETRPLPGIGCASWATCADLAQLGWTAKDPCASCVGIAISRLDGPALDTAKADALRALPGTDVGSAL